MQSLSESVVKLLPQHILRYDPHTICPLLKQAVDTSSIENHEMLDAEARSLHFKSGQELKDYVNRHRDVRMQVSGYRKIDNERNTVRYMVQGLAHHPDMHALAIMMACNLPNTIRELTNHLQQVQLIQNQAPTPSPQQPIQPATKWKKHLEPQRDTGAPKPRTTPRHYGKPKGHTGTWCHIHGSVTHSTDKCFARRYYTAPRKAQATTAAESS